MILNVVNSVSKLYRYPRLTAISRVSGAACSSTSIKTKSVSNRSFITSLGERNSFSTLSTSARSIFYRSFYDSCYKKVVYNEMVTYISPAKLKQRLEENKGDIQIIDVRDDDRADGHIEGSKWISSQTFASRAGALAEEYESQDKTLVFHCMFSQSRGPTCAGIFKGKLSAEAKCKVAVLEGGYMTWEQQFPDQCVYEEGTVKDEFGMAIPKNSGAKMFYEYKEGEKPDALGVRDK